MTPPGLPTCDQCNRPVAQVSRRIDPNGDFVFTFGCHGETEVHRFTRAKAECLRFEDVFARVFVTRN